MDGIAKEAQLVALDQPYLVPISDEKLVFYNMDVNTAVLTFQLKKGEYPLQISKANSDIYGVLFSKNGSRSGKLYPEFVDYINGIVRFTVDDAFLKASTETWVKGQVYVKAIGRKDTIAMSEFNFYVKDALINQISSNIKLSYIRMIDDFIEEARQKVDSAILGIDKVDRAQINFDSFIKGQKTDLDKTINNIQTQMLNLSATTQKDINDQMNQFRTEADNTLKTLQDTTNTVVTQTNLRDTLNSYITTADFNAALNKKADVGAASTDLPANITDLINQKVNDAVAKITTSNRDSMFDINGYVKRIDTPDFETMDFTNKSGIFYAFNPLNTPDTEARSGFVQVFALDYYTKKVIYMPASSNKIFVRTKAGQSYKWFDWVEVQSVFQSDLVDGSADDTTDNG